MSISYGSHSSSKRELPFTHLYRIIRHISLQSAQGKSVSNTISQLKQDLNPEALSDLAFVESLLRSGNAVSSEKIAKNHQHKWLCDLAEVVRDRDGDVLVLLTGLHQSGLHSQASLQRFWRNLQGAFSYLISVLVVMSVCTGVLVAKTIPAFESLFDMFGAQLPAFTSQVIAISRFVGFWWFLFLPVVALVLIPLALVPKSVSAWRPLKTWFRWLPGIRKLYLLHSHYLIVKYTHLLVRSGIPDNIALEEALMLVNEALDIASLAEKNEHFQDLAIAKKAGTLAPEIAYQQEHIEGDYLARLEVVKRRVEQFGYAAGGALVGAVVVAMYLPVFALGSLM